MRQIVNEQLITSMNRSECYLATNIYNHAYITYIHTYLYLTRMSTLYIIHIHRCNALIVLVHFPHLTWLKFQRAAHTSQNRPFSAPHRQSWASADVANSTAGFPLFCSPHAASPPLQHWARAQKYAGTASGTQRGCNRDDLRLVDSLRWFINNRCCRWQRVEYYPRTSTTHSCLQKVVFMTNTLGVYLPRQKVIVTS